MNDPAPGDTALDAGYTTERYLALRDEGALTPDDRVELLEGVIVAVPPQSPSHAGTTSAVADAIRRAVGTRAAVREEKPLVLAPRSMPEPDVAVVRGRHADYRRAHPTTALLVIEVAESSLPQDRLTKSRIYARARIEEFWIVNLREDRVEVFRDPDPARRVYRTRFVAARGERLAVAELPGVTVETNDLLPAESDG